MRLEFLQEDVGWNLYRAVSTDQSLRHTKDGVGDEEHREG